MNFEVIAVPRFVKDAKKLSKKYPSLKEELRDLFNSLEVNPIQGKSLGNQCFKLDYLSAQSIRANLEELESLLMSLCSIHPFIFFVFTTNQKRRILAIKNCVKS